MLGLLAASIAGGIAACTKRMRQDTPTVVLYSSVDDEYLRLVVARFESKYDIRVLVKGDTEATKTTGIAERLRALHASGTLDADVWWSSEPFLTIALADEGVLVPMEVGAFGDLPFEACDERNFWAGFARRARVVVRRGDLPADPTDILDAAFTDAGPAIARASFGTTRGHFGAVLATVGEERYVAWLKALRAGGTKVYDGNSAVVRAVAGGEAALGLTDTDDVWAGKREGWDVSCSAAVLGVDGGAPGSRRFIGPLMIPNTVALVNRVKKSRFPRYLTRFIMSEEVERLLMESDSHNMPVRAELMKEMRERFAPFVVEDSAGALGGVPVPPPVAQPPTLRAIAAAAPRAVELARSEGLA